MTDNEQSPARGAIFNIKFDDKKTLYHHFMSQVKNGGLFVATVKKFQLGDEVFMVLTLPEDTANLAVAGKVVWITPAGAQGSRPEGVGVQFRDNGAANTRISALLAGMLDSDEPTFTL